MWRNGMRNTILWNRKLDKQKETGAMNKMICKGKLYLGKCDRNGGGRKSCAGYLTWALQQGEYGSIFTAQGEVWNHIKTDIIQGGQCLNEILTMFPRARKARRIVEVWRKHHLNDMKAGTPEQMREVEVFAGYCKENGEQYPDYRRCVDWLKEAGLYEVPLTPNMRATGGFPQDVIDGKRGYRYGERWLFQEIPAEVIEEIKSW